jgi:hypothetical protein
MRSRQLQVRVLPAQFNLKLTTNKQLRSKETMSIWDELDKEASVDDRLGNHDFVVDKVTTGSWPSGDVYYELDGRLTTANNFNLRQRFSPEPSEEDVIANKANWDRNMKKAMVLAHQNAEVLDKEYGTKLELIKAGDSFRVKTDYQTKDGKKYIRLISFLPKGAALGASATTAGNAPF